MSRGSKTDSSMAQFRPSKLEPPKIGTSSVVYNDYIQSYRLYVNALKALKSEFWAETKSTKDWAFQDSPAYRVFNNKGTFFYTDKKEDKPEDYRTEQISVVSVVPRDRAPSPEKARAEVAVKKSDPEVKKARRRRQRRNRRARDVKAAISLSADLVKLAENNSALKKAKYTFGTIGVSPHSVLIKGTSSRAPKRANLSSTVPEESPRQAALADKSSGGVIDTAKPNRKDRRRAIYGPPKAPEKVPEVKSAPLDPWFRGRSLEMNDAQRGVLEQDGFVFMWTWFDESKPVKLESVRNALLADAALVNVNLR